MPQEARWHSETHPERIADEESGIGEGAKGGIPELSKTRMGLLLIERMFWPAGRAEKTESEMKAKLESRKAERE
jgi:hypothetical protein